MQKRIVDEKAYPLPGFFDLFSRRDELMIQQTELLKQIIAQLQAGGALVGGEQRQPAPGGGITPIRRVLLHDHLKPYRASTTYYPNKPLADCSKARESILIVVMSTCDQNLTVQAIGSLGDQADAISSFNIGASQALTSPGMIGLGVDLSVNWYPYLGVSIASGVAAPVAGDAMAWAFIREA
jgi:hypothetical protein